MRRGYDEIRRIEILMTDWERPGEPESDVVRINKAAGKQAVQVSAETFEVIEKSLEMSRKSDGAFDITFAAMKGLWKFDEDLEKKLPPAGRDQAPPQADQLARRRPRQRSAHGEAAPAGHAPRAGRDRERLRGGPCAGVLRGEGLADFMVQAGGDLFVAGSKGPTNWMVGVRDPRGGPRDIIARMPIKDHAFSTAGDYERVVRARRQALPPHHRSGDRLPGDRVARGDDLRAHRVPRGRAGRRGLHPRARRRGSRWSSRSPTARR